MHMRESGDRDELMEVVVRLKSVTSGWPAQELSLKRNAVGQLGFHVQPDGVVTQVEDMGLAWQAGLRQGARLVEVGNAYFNEWFLFGNHVVVCQQYCVFVLYHGNKPIRAVQHSSCMSGTVRMLRAAHLLHCPILFSISVISNYFSTPFPLSL